jgi:hypothetical protein
VIGGRRIAAPDGTTWRIGRRWWPERKRLRRRRKDRDSELPDGGSEDGDAPGGGGSASDAWWRLDLGVDADEAIVILGVVVAVIAAIVLFATVVVPLVVLGIEILLLIVVFVGGLAGRLLFRRPWTIRARSADGRELTWRAVGFRRSGRMRDEIAAALSRGQTDVQPAEAEAVTVRTGP